MIKSFFNPGIYPNHINIGLMLLRFVVGVSMLTHGMVKLSKLTGDAPILFADPIGLGETVSLALAVFSEVFCSMLLILGLATRFAVIPLLITMAVAIFIVHTNDGFGKQELPLLYTAIYTTIAITGAGKISMDHWIFRKAISNRGQLKPMRK